MGLLVKGIIVKVGLLVKGIIVKVVVTGIVGGLVGESVVSTRMDVTR